MAVAFLDSFDLLGFMTLENARHPETQSCNSYERLRSKGEGKTGDRGHCLGESLLKRRKTVVFGHSAGYKIGYKCLEWRRDTKAHIF